MEMKRILLDTSAYSGFVRGHPGIVEAMKKAEDVFFYADRLGGALYGIYAGVSSIQE